MPFYKGDLLNHFKKIQFALANIGGAGRMDARTFALEVGVGQKARILYPQFITSDNGVRRYTSTFGPATKRFLGWCPYQSRCWEMASEKLTFKAFAMRNEIRTPSYSTNPGETIACVVVKNNISSPASTIKGPLRSSLEYRLNNAAGEYYERFVPGMITKIWYWTRLPVCLEFEKMPSVIGDDVATVGRLVERRGRGTRQKLKIDSLIPFLRYQGITPDSVLAKGQELLVDFRYGSPLLDRDLMRNVDLIEDTIPALARQISDIGDKLWRGIPQEVRSDAVFTVDAVIDAEERVWALEMNSSPFMHPYVYPVMLNGLFASEKEPRSMH